jgi:hypothetical protein
MLAFGFAVENGISLTGLIPRHLYHSFPRTLKNPGVSNGRLHKLRDTRRTRIVTVGRPLRYRRQSYPISGGASGSISSRGNEGFLLCAAGEVVAQGSASIFLILRSAAFKARSSSSALTSSEVRPVSPALLSASSHRTAASARSKFAASRRLVLSVMSGSQPCARSIVRSSGRPRNQRVGHHRFRNDRRDGLRSDLGDRISFQGHGSDPRQRFPMEDRPGRQ